MKLKKGDFVQLMKGKDAGKKGRILAVEKEKDRVLIEGVNFVKRHTKPGGKNRQGGIMQKEMPVSAPNVRFFCLKCNKPVRLGFMFVGGNKVRYCKKCREITENIK